MNEHHSYCVIMAGGLGTRFWPVSRDSRPKQFLNFSRGGKSFLRMAWERAIGVVPEQNILVVSLERYRDLVLKEIPGLHEENLLLEPHNRNTASCIAYATCTLLKRDPEAVVLVTPADHMISDTALFCDTVRQGLDYAAEHDVILTLGVMPRRPDPNFGYIQTDGPAWEGKPVKVKTFTEKPSREMAKVFIDSGEFLWNSGIFIWKASVIYEELAKYVPQIAGQWNGWEQFVSTPHEQEYLQRIYQDMPRTSIDYAVMEKSDRVMAIPSRFDWTDLGNWESLYEYFSDRDVSGNAIRVGGKLLSRHNSGSMVLSPKSNKLVAVRGLKDYLVLDLEDVLFICPRDEQSIKDFISELLIPEYEDFR